MTTKPKARKFRIRRETGRGTGGDGTRAPVGEGPVVQDSPGETAESGVDQAAQLDAIRREGLTGRQLRMARRVAQKHGIAVTSDFDAVRQLRAKGIDPFKRDTILELVAPDAPPEQVEGGALAKGKVQLPQTIPAGETLPSTKVAGTGERRVSEIRAIQRDIARRRRRKLALLGTRLSFFVLLPTILVGWYYFAIATPMYATNSEFVIQQAEAQAAPGGLGGLLQGTSMATQQDSTTVQSYLASREAMARLDEDQNFKAHFSQDFIDPIQRLEPGASNETAFALYQEMVKVSYDPTEGLLRMEVIAADPQTSQAFSDALIDYAEERVDQMSLKPREDGMQGARQALEEAEAARAQALDNWLRIQEKSQQIDPLGETAARTQQISALETERQQLQLTLQDRLNVRRPNQAQVAALQDQIANIDGLIAELRQLMTNAGDAGTSQATRNIELRRAEEDYTYRTAQVQEATAALELAQREAARQVRYLSLGVKPIAPDEATYPRAFENTILAFLVFAGIYLMVSLTAAILREQVSA